MTESATESAGPLLHIKSLSKIFGDIPVVDRVDLAVTQGEIVMIIGPSGAGKSTLLRCVNRIEIPSEGEVLLDGINMAGERRNGNSSPMARSPPRASVARSAWCSSASTCSLPPDRVGHTSRSVRAACWE